MSQLHLTQRLLSPSLMSGLLVVILVIGLVGGSAWTYIDSSQLFYKELFGPFGLATALLYATDFFTVTRTLWNSPATYAVLIFVCAVVAGILTYTLIEGTKRIAHETSTVWYEYRVHTPEAQKAVRETVTRIAIRCISLFSWAIYLLAFVNILVPFCVLLLETGIATIANGMPQGWWAVVGVCAFLMVSLHLNVTFLRLSLLRTRVVGE